MIDKDSIRKYATLIKVILIIVAVSLLIYFCLQNYSFFLRFIARVNRILQPIFYGILIAYLLSPICSRIQGAIYALLIKKGWGKNPKKIAHLSAVGISIVLFICVLLAVIMLIIPRLVTNIMNFIDSYPSYAAEAQKNINKLLNSGVSENKELLSYWRELTDYLNSYLKNTFLPNVNSIVNRFSTSVYNLAISLFNFLIGLIVAVYCLDKRRVFALQAKKILFAFTSQEMALDILTRVESANSIFLKFLIGKLIDSAIIGVLCFIGVVILRINNPVLIAVFIGVSNIIPFFGPFLGAIPCTILILLENPLQALYFVIFIFLLQQFDGNILGPKILGDSTGISSFWILFSILLFGGLWGVFGMLIAVPLFVVIYNFIKEITNSRLQKKGLPITAYDYDDVDELVEKTKHE